MHGVTTGESSIITSARKHWLNVHAYLGLFAGAVLALLGLTGSILVFQNQIDLLLNPQLVVKVGAARNVTYDDVAEIVLERYGKRPYYIEAPAATGKYVAFTNVETQSAVEVRFITVDANSGRILDSRPWGDYFVSFVRKLHTDLFLGQSGLYIVGSVGILSLVSILTGLYLWWPRPGQLRRALLFRWRPSARALNFEIHRFCGFYTGAILFVISLTGIYLALPEPYKAAVGIFSPLTAPPDVQSSSILLPGARPMSLYAVERIVAEHLPGAEITGYQLPRSRDETFRVYYRGPLEPVSEYGRSMLWIDQFSGQVLETRDYKFGSTGDRFISSQRLLHNGQIFGLPGRLLVFIAGLLIPGMYGTGVYLWWTRRRRARRV